MKESKKILINTVDAWNNRVGANTMSSIFSVFPKENLANIYIRPQVPNSPVCENYFQISEMDLIKSIIFKNTITGHRFSGKEQNIESKILDVEKKHTRLYKIFAKRRFWLFILIRELLWKLGKWKSQEFINFIKVFSPDVIVNILTVFPVPCGKTTVPLTC